MTFEMPFYLIWAWHELIRRHTMEVEYLELGDERKVRFTCSCGEEWNIYL